MAKDIYKEIKQERKSQNEKWGEQNHQPIEWIAILTEEVGEASKEALDYRFKNLVKRGVDKYHPDPEDQQLRLSRYREEMIQVAAVAVQMIECLDRNRFKD